MPTSTTSLTTLRPDLGDSFREFDTEADRRGFIGAQVLPVAEVAKASGTYGIIPIEQLLQDNGTDRKSGSAYNRGNWQFDDASFATVERGFEEPVDANEAAMYSDYFDAEQVSAELAVDQVLRDYEKRVAAAVFNATTWTGAALTTAITNEWDDYDNAVPVQDVESATQTFYDNSGLWPNAIVLNRKVFRNLRLCSEIIEKVHSTGAGSSVLPENITVSMIAQAFDLPYVLVAGGSKNTAIENQSASISPVWSDEYAMICRVSTTGNFKEPCIGRTFHWSEDGSTLIGTVEQYEEPQTRADIIRCRHQTDEVILYTQMGHLLSNVTT